MDLSEEEIRKLIREDISRMQGFEHPESLELIKRSIRHEVGLLRRMSLASFVFAKLHEHELALSSKAAGVAKSPEKASKTAEGHKGSHLGDGTQQADDSVVSFWCNRSFHPKAKGDEFLRFVEKESGIPSGSTYGYSNVRTYSFFKVKEEFSDKVRERFSQPVPFEGRKIVIRIKGERQESR